MTYTITTSGPWWMRIRFVRWARHRLGKCTGAGMVSGAECGYCFAEMCRASNAMYTHVAGDWEELPLDTCLALVAKGQASEITGVMIEYDDGMRSFQCVAPCVRCDVSELEEA